MAELPGDVAVRCGGRPQTGPEADPALGLNPLSRWAGSAICCGALLLPLAETITGMKPICPTPAAAPLLPTP